MIAIVVWKCVPRVYCFLKDEFIQTFSMIFGLHEAGDVVVLVELSEIQTVSLKCDAIETSMMLI